MKEEKRGLERRKDDVDEVQKLQIKLKQEQQHWEKECATREKQQVGLVHFNTEHLVFRHLSSTTEPGKQRDVAAFTA